MNFAIDAATASIITAVIVGFISTITTIIANNNSFRQQQAQWVREEQKAERDARAAEKNRELELKKANFELLQEIYGNSIASLTTLLIYNDGIRKQGPDYSKNLAEVQKWLSLYVPYIYDKASDECESFLEYYRMARDSNPIAVKELREKMIEYLAKDPRLQT